MNDVCGWSGVIEPDDTIEYYCPDCLSLALPFSKILPPTTPENTQLIEEIYGDFTEEELQDFFEKRMLQGHGQTSLEESARAGFKEP